MKELVIVAALGLSACVPLGDDTVEVVPKEGACPAPGLGHLLGQPINPDDVEAIETPIRILPHGAMMTSDHIPERLNVDLDETGRVGRLWCG